MHITSRKRDRFISYKFQDIFKHYFLTIDIAHDFFPAAINLMRFYYAVFNCKVGYVRNFKSSRRACNISSCS